MNDFRNLTLTAAGYKPQVKRFEDRDHLVLPVVALVEGVVRALNSNGPELVRAERFAKQPLGWNGRPVFHGHPMRNGKPVSGNLPEILAQQKIGTVFGANVADNKLKMEAWLDVARCESVAPELLTRAKAGEPIEISVGAFVEVSEESGVHNNRRYAAAWNEILPDHLALLPDGDEGACSRKMGCGVRAAQFVETPYEFDEPTDLRFISQETRDSLDKSDFAGPNESFPIQKPEDVEAASHALGRAKGDRASIKRRIIAIAYRKGDAFVSRLPEDWKRKSDQKNASAFTRLMAVARSFFRAEQDADQMSSKDLNDSLTDALREIEGQYCYVEAFYPVTDPTHVAYTVMDPMSYPSGDCCYERSFTLSDAGVVTLGGTRVEVMRVVTYEPADGASPENDDEGAARSEYNRAIRGMAGNGSNQYASKGAAAARASARAEKAGAGKPGSDRAIEAHDRASDAHQRASDAARAQGLHTIAVAHQNAADAHNEAAGAHENHRQYGGREKEVKQTHDAATAAAQHAARGGRYAQNSDTGDPGSTDSESPISSNKESDMKREDVVKALEKATDCQIDAIGKVLAGQTETPKPQPTEAELKAAKDKEAADRKAEIDAAVATAIKGLTFEQVLDKATPDVRAAINAGGQEAKDRKEATIKALKESGRCIFGDDELKDMSQTQLDKLMKLGDVPVVDYSAQAPRAASKDANDKTTAPPAPDMTERLRAARGQAKK